MSLYIAIPFTSHILTEVATGTVIKTLLQVATPSTTNIRVRAWGISFAGIVATGEPGEATLIDTNVAATVTTLTPNEYGNADQVASLCIGGTALTGYNGSAEGSITASIIIDGQKVHPQTGYAIWYPADSRPLVKASRFLRIRTNFAVSADSVPWILWEEPA